MRGNSTKENSNKYLLYFDYVVCLLLALAYAAAPYYIQSGDCRFSLALIETSLIYYVIFLLCTAFIRLILCSNHQNLLLDKCTLLWERIMNGSYASYTIALAMFFLWLPSLIFLYPGTLVNDTWGQLRQFIQFTTHTGRLNAWQPVFDTFLMGFAIVPLSNLTGRWHIVIFLYVLIQSVITALVFSRVVIFVNKRLNLGLYVSLSIFIVYSIFPLFPILTQNVSKDSIFSWIFTLFYIEYIEIMLSHGSILNSKKFILHLTVLSVLCSLTKKVGFYVVLLSLFVLFIFIKDSQKKVSIPIVCLIVLHLITPTVQSVFNVIPGGRQEMFSIPFQQTARYVRDYGHEVSEDEYIVIDQLLDMSDLAERYNPVNADPVKGYSERGTVEDYVDYIEVWIKQGFRHPESYLSSLNAMAAPWFSFEKLTPKMDMNHHTQLNVNYIPEWVPNRGWSAYYAESYQKTIDSIFVNPFTRVYLTMGFYVTLIPSFALTTTIMAGKRKKTRYWIVVIPILLSVFLGCLLAPVSIGNEGYRYIIPIIYTTPLIIAWCAYSMKQGNEKDF